MSTSTPIDLISEVNSIVDQYIEDEQFVYGCCIFIDDAVLHILKKCKSDVPNFYDYFSSEGNYALLSAYITSTFVERVYEKVLTKAGHPLPCRFALLNEDLFKGK